MTRLALGFLALIAFAVWIGNASADGGWGNIKGRVVWNAELPKVQNLNMPGAQPHCLLKGPIADETYVVDPKTKGMKNIYAYLKGKIERIHPDYPQTKEEVRTKFEADFVTQNGIGSDGIEQAIGAGKVQVKDIKAPVVLDQQFCKYVPHALAVRAGQRVLAKNYEPVTHNVKIDSFNIANNFNPNMPSNTIFWFDLMPDSNPLSISCGQHSWMKMSAMVFDHPYFAVTGTDGSFEIKNVPAGKVSLVLRNPKYIDALKGGKGKGTGAPLTIEDGKTLDLGEIKFSDE